MRTKILAATETWTHRVLIQIQQTGNDGRVSLASAITFKEVGPGQFVDPPLSLNPDDAQALMDNLWDCGIRPTQGAGSAGALAATQGHLEDMRRIAFKLIDGGGA